MKSAFLAVATALVAASALDLSAPAINPDIVESVNNAGALWVAGVNDRFINMTIGQVKAMLGTKRGTPENAAARARLGKWDGKIRSDLPTNFDVRTNWPQCTVVSGHVRDQSSCGSCWAFGSTEAFNDRLCIAKGFTTLLSPLDTMSCCNLFNGCFGSSGCDGGIPDEAWSYFTTKGVVTGGDYGDNQTATCANYPFAQCAHHEPGKYPNCPTNEYNTPNCPSSCTNNGYNTAWSSDKHFASTSYSLDSVEAAMSDIAAYGSITAAFNVYEDFITYKSGIYHHVSGQLLGGHAIKIVGWGVDAGVDYWIVQNSWNQYWGNNGYFYIRRGTDECGIEDDLVAGKI